MPKIISPANSQYIKNKSLQNTLGQNTESKEENNKKTKNYNKLLLGTLAGLAAISAATLFINRQKLITRIKNSTNLSDKNMNTVESIKEFIDSTGEKIENIKLEKYTAQKENGENFSGVLNIKNKNKRISIEYENGLIKRSLVDGKKFREYRFYDKNLQPGSILNYDSNGNIIKELEIRRLCDKKIIRIDNTSSRKDILVWGNNVLILENANTANKTADKLSIFDKATGKLIKQSNNDKTKQFGHNRKAGAFVFKEGNITYTYPSDMNQCAQLILSNYPPDIEEILPSGAIRYFKVAKEGEPVQGIKFKDGSEIAIYGYELPGLHIREKIINKKGEITGIFDDECDGIYSELDDIRDMGKGKAFKNKEQKEKFIKVLNALCFNDEISNKFKRLDYNKESDRVSGIMTSKLFTKKAALQFAQYYECGDFADNLYDFLTKQKII